MTYSIPRKATDITALYPVVVVENPALAAAELKDLVILDTVFEAEWYHHLKSQNGECQIGFVQYNHVSVPESHNSVVQGAFVTIDCDDVRALWHARPEGLDILVKLTDEDWGQRHFIVRLRSGVLVDFVQLLDQ